LANLWGKEVMLSWLALNWVGLLEKALLVIGAASAFVKVVAPLTKWSGDDKVGRFLDKLLAFAGRLALNPKP
jgi:hypothetical protein